jgi:signal transduction histidine kinase
MDQVPEDIRENMTAIKETSAHLNQLINDLLEIARSESGTVSIAVSPHPFPPILERVTEGVSSLLQEKSLTLQVDVAPLLAVLCDETKLREVLLNLVSNAIKYNREGGVITIKAYLNEARSKMICEVKDTGFGIPKDRQDRIFQKFFRASTPGTEGVIGTGLGLFLTRMLVEKMGGKISFSSVEQEGTTFTFTLPVAPA